MQLIINNCPKNCRHNYNIELAPKSIAMCPHILFHWLIIGRSYEKNLMVYKEKSTKKFSLKRGRQVSTQIENV